ncbi:pilus assembly protein [Cupriavidus agavae]|uniref:Type IV pilus assembly protein PilY1 n=1 Tax=Cupriavidus agavae TaxID=1001822 RepID=A0A4Q7S4N5_9BURK|nr:PilC/PilY family type IV pilus protein [Cupriavidus agavae]RZT41394.1 type IV pilus assembly protein PilY1 [Cupriavidus agavae]
MKILQRLLPLVALCLATTVTTVLAAPTPTVPTVSIATTPLYGKVQNLHPNLLLALSVEYPTTGAAYRSAYSPSTEYVGYFNSAKCYTYDATAGYFKIAGNASATRTCSGQFSGNFMNWAASSAIDMLRLAMTGGDRVVDSRTQTVLQRAVLQADFFRNGQNFPVKSIENKVNGVAPSDVTPYKYNKLYTVSCGNHVFFSDSDSGSNCDSPGEYADKVDRNKNVTERRSYRAQVQVCDSSEATSRTDLCFSYDGTNYKPVGEMQRNAERVRFAAFGYLNDNYKNSNAPQERYGGVLRAPMKYLGNSAVNTDLKTITNTAKEWDAYGVLATNPLSDSTGNSGVINYLNKFGRTTLGDMGAPTNNPKGVYKTYDPLSELFYESIRYLQFHPSGPTTQAVESLANAANFAVYNTWKTDPMLNRCQRNYVLTIGDINTHQDNFIPGNTITNRGDQARAKDSYSGFDVMDWTNRVGALEANDPNVGNARPNTSLKGLGSKTHPTADGSSYYLAGVAYWAHTSAFRPDMPEARVTTFGIDVDEGGNGTVDSKRTSQIYLGAKYGGFANAIKDGGNEDGNPFKTLVNGQLTTSGTEWETAPGSNLPTNWFLASQPADMIRSIRKVFDVVANSGGTLAGIALSSNTVYTDQTVYTPGYDSQWNGKLTAYPLVRGKDGSVSISSTQKWEAGSRLAGRTIASRAIYTLNPLTGGTAFQWNGISKDQQALLNTNPDTGANDGQGSKRLDFLRGDRGSENDGLGNGGVFRQRQTRLGDIINSAPVYVGAPAPSRIGTGYSTFFNTYESRTPIVYVGANDGMLHGFNATTGDEVLAYVPNALFGTLNQLTSQTYNHRAYVDATPTVTEAQINDRWRSVLAGGFGGGAQGVYALDVTDPATFGAGNVLWEFTDQDDKDMGNLMGKPVITRLMTGKDSKGVAQYGWFVIVGNGLNSNLEDKSFNADAPSTLFILSLDKGATEKWLLGTNYWKITPPGPKAVPPYTTANGMSTPVVVAGSTGAALAAYAGDLQGNLWKFLLSGGKSTWHAGDDGALPAYGGVAGTPMFIATDKATKARQPITMQPSVAYAPGGFLVAFGTGKYYEINDADPTPASGNSFYGIFDGNTADYAGQRSELNELKMQYTANGSAITYTGTPLPLGYSGRAKPGWVMDFLDKTERQITSSALSGGLLYFNSVYTSIDSCNTSGGSREYTLNVLTGLPVNGTTGVKATGLLGAPTIIVTTRTSDARDSVGGNIQTTTTRVLSFGADGTLSVGSGGNPTAGGGGVETQKRNGRQGWREVRNFKMN